MTPTTRKLLPLLAVLLPVAVAFWILCPRTDVPGYLDFVDRRDALGIPNATNVLSNLPFLVVGIWGMAARTPLGREWSFPLRAFSLGLVLTAVGSSLFHWEPSPATLFWDRLPMTISFTAIFALVIADRIDPRLGFRALLPLEAIGAASVVFWRLDGDLRPYGLVQYVGLVAVLAVLAFHRRGRLSTAALLSGLGLYAFAKVFEVADGAIFSATAGLVSGHSIKHLAAAAGAALVVRTAVRPSPKMEAL